MTLCSADDLTDLCCRLWDDLSLELDTAVCTDVLTDIVSTVQSLRSAVASSLRQLLEDDSEHLSTVLELAMSLYQEKLYVSEDFVFGIFDALYSNVAQL